MAHLIVESSRSSATDLGAAGSIAGRQFTACKRLDCSDGLIVLVISILTLKAGISPVGGPRELGLLPIPQLVTLQGLPK